jgi:hypothetical protein
MFICKICRQTFESIPDGSIPIGERRSGGYQLFRFPGRQPLIHDLRLVAPKRTLNREKANEELDSSPEPATELLESVKAILSELPTPIPEPPPETTMSIAFRNLKAA